MTAQKDTFIPTKEQFSATAHVKSLEDYQRLYKLSLEQPEAFWGEMAQQLTWFHTPDTVFDLDAEQVDFSWFGGGKLNAAFNCVDRHAKARPGKPAIIWAKNEPGEYEVITFRDRQHHVGRVDDVLNVSGHRLGTAEVESALVAHESVAEAAVVNFRHDLKGTGVCAFVTMKPDWAEASSEQMVGALKEQVRHVIGPIATPDRVVLVNGLPKTRSGKILRRMLRKIASGETENLGDATTLADPSVLDELLAKGMPPQAKR